MKVYVEERSLRKEMDATDSEAGSIEETKQVIMSDTIEGIEPNFMIKPESPEAPVADEEPFNSVTSSYSRIKDISRPVSEDDCSDTNDSVGQEHSR